MNAQEFFEKHAATLLNIGYEQFDASDGESVDSDEALRIATERWDDIKVEFNSLSHDDQLRITELTELKFIDEFDLM